MKNNRAVIYVIGALCLITLVLGIVGLTNKGSSNNNVAPTPVDSNIAKIDYAGDVQNIISVEEKMSSFDLVKANKEFSSGYLKIYIDNNIVKIEIQKAATSIAWTMGEKTLVISFADGSTSFIEDNALFK